MVACQPDAGCCLAAGETPLSDDFDIPKAECSAVVKIIAREVCKCVVRLPGVKTASSMTLDANVYTFTTSVTGHQQIEVVGFA